MACVMKAVLLFLLVGLVTETSAASDPLCVVLKANLYACQDILCTGILKGALPSACCDGLKVIKKVEELIGLVDVVKVCLAINPGAPITSGHGELSSSLQTALGADISAQIQAACGVNLGFSIEIS